MTPNIDAIPLCFATSSLPASVNLATKLRAIAAAGFKAIELSMPDLLSFASLPPDREPDSYSVVLPAARSIRDLCASLALQILVLQPFSHLEGHTDPSARRDAFTRARGWIDIMAALGTGMLQVGSSDAAHVAADVDVLAADLGELADLLAQRGMRVAYENWCWATRASTWIDVARIVDATGRENVGLCLDTFQTAGGEYGDPTEEGGVIGDDKVGEKYTESLQKLGGLNKDKIFYVQVSDAYVVEPPLDKKETDGLRPRERWSHDWRPLPYDGGYLPIRQFVAEVLKTGYRGWFSVETFDGKFEEKYGGDVDTFTKKSYESCRQLLREAMGNVERGTATE